MKQTWSRRKMLLVTGGWVLVSAVWLDMKWAKLSYHRSLGTATGGDYFAAWFWIASLVFWLAFGLTQWKRTKASER